MKKKDSTKKISNQDLDKKFDEGNESVLEYFDTEIQRASVDMPKWMLKALDREAKRLGITRQSLIKIWLAEKLDKAS